MANILILGGGFSGVAAAESLAKQLTSDHQITLVSRSSRFVAHPSLVDFAFGKHGIDDISHDLRETMHDRRIRFVQGEIARVDPYERLVTLAHGEVRGQMPYDYLIFALGGRLATERITGFYEHAHHTLTVEAALKFGEAIRGFKEGRAVIGYSPETRLAVPAYETAFALSRFLEDRGERGRAQITIVSPERMGAKSAASESALRDALNEQNIELLRDVSINRATAKSVVTSLGARIDYDLLMLLPPLRGASAVRGMGITDQDGFIRVDKTMRVRGVEGMYAVGDCASFPGPKLGHMAVSQGEVAASNLAAEVEAREPKAQYEHEMMLALDQEAQDSILNKQFWVDGKVGLRKAGFPGLATVFQNVNVDSLTGTVAGGRDESARAAGHSMISLAG